MVISCMGELAYLTIWTYLLFKAILDLMTGKARSYGSRCKEFNLFFCYLNDPRKLLEHIKKKSSGDSVIFEGINFEYGNIARLIDDIEISNINRPFSIRPKYICHVDHIGKSRKIEIEKLYRLKGDPISSSDSKVDILIIDDQGNVYFISYKDSDEVTKLGQRSAKLECGDAVLQGGLSNILIPSGQLKSNISWQDTDLDESQFKKLNHKDKEFAYFKKHQPLIWSRMVQKELELAVNQIRAFGEDLGRDVSNLSEFIEKTFAGNLGNSENFYLVLGNTPIQFLSILKSIRKLSPKVSLEIHQPKNKTSLIINLELNGKIYSLTKIEPSFEGAGSKISQTKGIIYHFQQYPNTSNSNHFKKLFFDISK